MASTRSLGAAFVAAAILAAPVVAICATQDSMTPQDRDAAADRSVNPPMAPAATGTATNASGVINDTTVAPNGDSNTLVTNGPIPDTPANRAKYGRPMSNAGKRTAPAGN
jgi:hypothetical protein